MYAIYTIYNQWGGIMYWKIGWKAAVTWGVAGLAVWALVGLGIWAITR